MPLYKVKDLAEQFITEGWMATRGVNRAMKSDLSGCRGYGDDEHGYAAPQLNLQTKGGDWYRSEFANVYVLDENVRDECLAQRGSWESGI